MTPSLPRRPPFALRARVLTPLASGGTLFESDGVVEVDAEGRVAAVADWRRWRAARADAPQTGALVDVRPWLLLPGLIDLHAHLPQVPNAGLGAGTDLLTWLDRYIFPLEQRFEGAVAERLAPAVCRALAGAGTTTAVLHGAAFASSVETAFRAAEAHGLRAVIGQVLMDRLSYETPPSPTDVLLSQSADLCARWHGRDRGRLRYAFTPRFAVSCTFELLRGSAALARTTGAYWQTHLAEDRAEVAEVARLFPDAHDYLDVYDQAGGLGSRSLVAHAIHLSDRELLRLAETGTRVAHCPESNLFLASGSMPLARYRQAGIIVGLGSDIAGGPQLSIFAAMRAGAYTQNVLRVRGDPRPIFTPLDWLALGTLEGARALGIEDATGSLEPAKDADLIVVDPELAAPLPGVESKEPDDLVSRLIFRAHPEMVRGAWVRGRLLEATLPRPTVRNAPHEAAP